jgi:hypothetical protein
MPSRRLPGAPRIPVPKSYQLKERRTEVAQPGVASGTRRAVSLVTKPSFMLTLWP